MRCRGHLAWPPANGETHHLATNPSSAAPAASLSAPATTTASSASPTHSAVLTGGLARQAGHRSQSARTTKSLCAGQRLLVTGCRACCDKNANQGWEGPQSLNLALNPPLGFLQPSLRDSCYNTASEKISSPRRAPGGGQEQGITTCLITPPPLPPQGLSR